MSFLFFYIGLINSNAQSGIVEYGTKYLGMSVDTSQIKIPELLDNVLMHDSNSKIALKYDESYYTLKFNIDGAKTEFIPIMRSDQMSLSPQDYILIGEYLYLDSKLYEKRDYGKESYYIKMDHQYKWQIHNEFKNVLGYKCQKATTIFKTKKRDIDIIAWFTPEIPISYGPYRYNGLPGLILEIQELGRLHYARKVKLKENIKLEFPSSDHLITENEFFNLYD